MRDNVFKVRPLHPFYLHRCADVGLFVESVFRASKELRFLGRLGLSVSVLGLPVTILRLNGVVHGNSGAKVWADGAWAEMALAGRVLGVGGEARESVGGEEWELEKVGGEKVGGGKDGKRVGGVEGRSGVPLRGQRQRNAARWQA